MPVSFVNASTTSCSAFFGTASELFEPSVSSPPAALLLAAGDVSPPALAAGEGPPPALAAGDAAPEQAARIPLVAAIPAIAAPPFRSSRRVTVRTAVSSGDGDRNVPGSAMGGPS